MIEFDRDQNTCIITNYTDTRVSVADQKPT